MKQAAFWAIAMAVTTCGPAFADAASRPLKAIMPTKMTCEQLPAVDEVARPQIIYWSEGLNKKGKTEDMAVDIDRANRLVPVLADCKMEPHASYWAKMKKRFDMD